MAGFVKGRMGRWVLANISVFRGLALLFVSRGERSGRGGERESSGVVYDTFGIPCLSVTSVLLLFVLLR